MPTLVWRRGLKGPSPAVQLFDFVDEFDRGHLMTSTKLPPEHENLGIDELIKLYPAPKDHNDVDTSMVAKLA